MAEPNEQPQRITFEASGRRRKRPVTVEDVELLKEQAVAELLKVTPQTLRIWRCEGRGPVFLKMGRQVRYRLADVLAWQRKTLVVKCPRRL